MKRFRRPSPRDVDREEAPYSISWVKVLDKAEVAKVLKAVKARASEELASRRQEKPARDAEDTIDPDKKMKAYWQVTSGTMTALLRWR